MQLRGPGEILLLSCYELGHQPLRIASALAFLRRAGFAPATLDLSIEQLEDDAVRRAGLVAIAVPMHTALRIGVEAARRVRRINPGCHICLYGLYALLNAEELLGDGLADSVIGGESEQGLVERAEQLGNAGDNGGAPVVIATPPEAILTRLQFATPARETLPELTRYAALELGETRVPAGYVEASRGCLRSCRHCPVPSVYGGRFFVVPKETVLADVAQLVEAGARHITFGDPDFLNGPGHSFAVVRDLHERFADVTFDVTAKVDHLLRHRGRLSELKELGCLFVVSAIESLSNAVLARLDKGHTFEQICELTHLVREAGLTLRPTWLPFTPWSTLDDYQQMLRFVAAHGLIDQVDPVQYTVRLLIPPGSLLVRDGQLDGCARAPEPGTFSHAWSHPDPRMDRLAQEARTLVEGQAGQPAAKVFRELWLLVEQSSDTSSPTGPPTIRAAERPAPRLTEDWFC